MAAVLVWFSFDKPKPANSAAELPVLKRIKRPVFPRSAGQRGSRAAICHLYRLDGQIHFLKQKTGLTWFNYGLWHMVGITIVNGVYKPTYNWGGPSCTIYSKTYEILPFAKCRGSVSLELTVVGCCKSCACSMHCRAELVKARSS